MLNLRDSANISIDDPITADDRIWLQMLHSLGPVEQAHYIAMLNIAAVNKRRETERCLQNDMKRLHEREMQK